MGQTGMHMAEHMPTRLERVFGDAMVAATPLFLELSFKLSTTGSFGQTGVALLLFALSAGILFALLCSLPTSQQARRATRMATLCVFATVFSVEYFVFRQFKLYYDPVTVLSGAGGVASQFGSEAAHLVFSATGMAHIALFFLPAAAYTIYGIALDHDLSGGHSCRRLVQAGIALFATHVLALCLVVSNDVSSALYTTRHSFEGSTQAFGLITALKQEMLSAFRQQSSSFEVENQEQPKAELPQEEEPEAKSDPAVMDIDFDELASSTDNQTWADLDHYVSSLTPSNTNEYTGLFEGYNLIFISAEAFSAEAIRPDTTPTLQRMWDEGIQLTDYYQFDTAGTTGGECANLFGLLATEGGSSVKLTSTYNNYLTLGNLLNRRGYDGWAFHNNTYTYYGRDATHNNLGYNHGYMGYGNGMEEWVDWTWPESDLQMVAGTFDHLYGELGDKKHPFNVYYMSVSGHSNYDPGDNMMAQKNWDEVADLEYSDRVKGYLAANIELDRAMEYLLDKLEERGIAKRTVVVIAADHFPYGLDDDGPVGQLPYLSELYGYDVNNIFQRDHNCPIIWSGSLAKRKEPIVVDDPTMSIDLLPTLCNLFGLEWDSRLLPGRDVLDPSTEGISFNLNYDWRTSLGTYWGGSGQFEPVEGADVPEGYVEAHNTMVANKINYCHAVLTSDYYRHVFGDPKDVQETYEQARKELGLPTESSGKKGN